MAAGPSKPLESTTDPSDQSAVALRAAVRPDARESGTDRDDVPNAREPAAREFSIENSTFPKPFEISAGLPRKRSLGIIKRNADPDPLATLSQSPLSSPLSLTQRAAMIIRLRRSGGYIGEHGSTSVTNNALIFSVFFRPPRYRFPVLPDRRPIPERNHVQVETGVRRSSGSEEYVFHVQAEELARESPERFWQNRPAGKSHGDRTVCTFRRISFPLVYSFDSFREKFRFHMERPEYGVAADSKSAFRPSVFAFNVCNGRRHTPFIVAVEIPPTRVPVIRTAAPLTCFPRSWPRIAFIPVAVSHSATRLPVDILGTVSYQSP